MKTKFALINNVRTEPAKGLKGTCPVCGSDVIAKCGDVKVHHWAHKGSRNCDPWWENETEWHRAWKDNFDTNWQEIILLDQITGEKHIADVRTAHGLVIEFQHSHIEPYERKKREDFYKNMIWVVDGTRLKRDYPRFLKGKGSFRSTNEQGKFIVDFPDECFPSVWVGSSVPVIFDFKGIEAINDPKDLRNYLYCLFPQRNARESVVAILTRESFIKNIVDGKWFKQKQEPQQQSLNSPIENIPIQPQRQTEYVLHKRRFVKRKRF